MNPHSKTEVDAFRKEKSKRFRMWPGFSGNTLLGPDQGPFEIQIHENSEHPLTEDQKAEIRNELSPLPVIFPTTPIGPIKAQ